MQEYLASYAVKVDEDGARRLQSVLEQNRKTSASLAASFGAARAALASLKKDLTSSVGLKDVFSSLSGTFSGLSGSLSSLTGGPAGLSSSSGFAGRASLSVTADTKAADEAVAGFKAKTEAARPRLSVNTTGITSAVSSAIAAVRNMLSGLSVTIPVKAVTSLDTSGLRSQASASGLSVGKYASGGRVSTPTLAMIAEEGRPEYVIPVGDEASALPLLRSLMGELSASARAQLFLAAGAGASPAVSHSVQAPVNISVTAAAPAEAVGRSVYSAAQRSLLKTLQSVFA